jgi:hypothetical protein
MKNAWTLAFAAPLLMAQSAGTFSPLKSLTVPREFHTATLLPDGRVLIAGGFSFGNGPFSTWASTEIYDPSTASFISAGSMTAPRHMHTATLLPDGRVLIAGGAFGNGGDSQASAELYDPATGTFTATGSMTEPRSQHLATLLNTGKVLIAGGESITAELYDPSTGTFAATGNMTEAGFVGTSTLLADGRVLLTRSVSEFYEDHADLYDPTTGTFTRTEDLLGISATGPLVKPGEQPTATLLTNGKVLIAGGTWGDLGGSNIAEIFDPRSGQFTGTGTMTDGIGALAEATLLPEGRVLIVGRDYAVQCTPVIGQPQLGTCPGSAEVYDPATGAFGPPIPSQSEEGHRSTLLADGTVLLTGGFRCCGSSIDSAELYTPATLVPSPVLFSLSGNGQGQGAIWHSQTGQIASAGKPAVVGETLSMYTTSLAVGGVIPPQIAVGGRLAEVQYFGASGYPGYNQVNFRVPGDVTPGPAVSVRLTYLARPSNQVTIAVQ